MHIGLHKTGSTAIQNYCFENAKALLSAGILYPIGDLTKWHGHHPLVWELGVNHPFQDSKFSSDEIILPLLEESGFKTLLLSSEDFEFLSEKGINKLRENFPAKEYMIVVYIRNIFDYLFADYQQNVRMYGSRCSLTISDFFILYDFYSRINFIRLLDGWGNSFGVDAIRVFPYESVKRGIVEHFLKVIGFDLEKPKKPNFSNKSLSPVSTAALAQINQAFPDLIEKEHARLVEKLYLSSNEEDNNWTLITAAISSGMSRNSAKSIEMAGVKYKFEPTDMLRNTHASKDIVNQEIVNERLMKVSLL